jgi:enamine deaminase RidA (YjgF/YER057c/UK114 family)
MAEHQRLNPEGLFDAGLLAYHQVQISSGTRIVHIAGQVACNAAFELVGEGDFAAQVDQVFHNLKIAIEAADGTPDDIAALRIFVVDFSPDHVAPIKAALELFFGGAGPPGTLVGVSNLSMAGMLLEIEATAVL